MTTFFFFTNQNKRGFFRGRQRGKTPKTPKQQTSNNKFSWAVCSYKHRSRITLYRIVYNFFTIGGKSTKWQEFVKKKKIGRCGAVWITVIKFKGNK